jgi:hypothetical protein
MMPQSGILKQTLIATFILSLASTAASDPAVPDAPKLVVGIVVDQMRPDYIYRYWDKFEEGGFRRLVGQGFSFTHAHFDYMPTATGPGHAGIFTGTTPSVHGIMGNSWYVRERNRSINVVTVPGHTGVGSRPGAENNKAPSNLLTTTVGDELRLHTNMQSRVVSISRKDRSAMMMGGHLAQAYWYESATGNLVTSSYYRDSLPQWLIDFNARNLPQELLSMPWETLLPLESYTESISDANAYESVYPDQNEPVFPHNLPVRISDHDANPGLLSSTPLSDTFLTEAVFAAIDGEQLGQRGTTDLLALSYSTSDSIGHAYGPASVEMQDTYLRLDQNIARLLRRLDEQVGAGEYLVFLTSDHGAVHVPQYLVDGGVPGGYLNPVETFGALVAYLESHYGENLLQGQSNFELFLNHQRMDELGLDHADVQRRVARFMMSMAGVAGALTADALANTQFTQGIPQIVQNGYHRKRSGDVLIWLDPQVAPFSAAGTEHGSPWAYDRHAPMLWYGKNIPAGSSSAPVFIRDIASTVATFLRSPLPSGNTGNPMNEYMKR